MQLSKGARRILANLVDQADRTVSEVIRERGGSAGKEEAVMNAIAQAVGDVDPLLLPDRDEPYRLHDAFEKVIDGCRDEVVLSFADCFLRFKVEPNDDTITAEFHDKKPGLRRGYRSIGHDEPWCHYLNRECGWTWLAVNQQGYWDTVLLSFDSVIPNILLNVMASSIHVFAIGPLQDARKGNRAVPGESSNTKRPKGRGMGFRRVGTQP